MGRIRRALIGWTIATSAAACGAALCMAPDAPAAFAIPDAVGDSTAAAHPLNAPACGPAGCRPACALGCPDITAVHVSEAGGRIVVEVQSATPWGSAHAYVRLNGQRPDGQATGILLGPVFLGPPQFERFLADPTRYVYRLDPTTAFDGPGAFMAPLPTELRVQAVAGPLSTNAFAVPADYFDLAPDAGEATYRLDNRDGDVVPDIRGDPCPDAAESDPPEGWENGRDNRFGCPALAPFSHEAFVAEAKRTERALLARWRDPRRRAAALRRGRLTVPFGVPGGGAQVLLRVFRATGPRTLSLTLGTRFQDCPAGRCPLLARVFPHNVRKLAGKRLTFLVAFRTEGASGAATSYRSGIRMRAR